MSTTVIDNEVQDYVDAVALALAGLPEPQRVEVLEDLAAHLSEFDRDEGSLIDQLGDPTAYADELRASAGLTNAAGPPPTPSAVAQIASRVGHRLERARSHRGWRATVSFLPELLPAWWVARAWFLLAAMSDRTAADLPYPRVGDSTLLGLILLGVAIPASVQLGRFARAGRRVRWDWLATGVGVIAALVAVADIRHGSTRYVHTDSYSGTQSWSYSPVLGENGAYVGDVEVPLDRDGTPLFRWDGPDQILVDGVGRDVGPCPFDRYAACLVPLEADAPAGPSASGASGEQQSDESPTTSGTTAKSGPSGPTTDPDSTPTTTGGEPPTTVAEGSAPKG